MNPGILYISYDGMLEPLGQSQVLAYLERLAKGCVIHLVSFEKPADWAREVERERLRQRIAAAGIRWHPLRYHKRPSAPATAFDIAQGTAVGLWLVLRHRLGIVHARSYVPALMALAVKRMTGARFLFDMRGFWADERVDGGLWPREGRMYRVAKWFERRFLLGADCVVSLTRAAVDAMRSFPYLQGHETRFEVIPTCADLERFLPRPHGRNDDGFTLGYVGSAGTWYLFDETLACFAALAGMRPGARFLILNRGEHDFIRDRLAAHGIDPGRVELRAVAHEEVPEWMARMDAGIFFYKPVFSKLATAPTKLAEFLGCGVPCLGNAGVGDMAAILEGGRVGVALDSFEPQALRAGLERLLELCAEPDIRERCRQAALRHFSLDDGVAAYAGIYARLTG